MKRWGSLLLASAAVCTYLLIGVPPASAGGSSVCAGTPDATINAMGTSSWSPNTETLPLGSTVCWVNTTGISHTVTSDTGAWTSDSLTSPDTFEHIFSTAGTYQFHCSIHPVMIGTIFIPPVTISTTPASGSNDTNPTVSGTGPPTSTVDVYEGSPCGTLIDTTSTNGSGNWSYALTEAQSLTSGTTTQFSARAVAPSNGLSSACTTSPASYTPGTSGPDITIDSGPGDTTTTSDNTPTWMFHTTYAPAHSVTCSVDTGARSFSDCSSGSFTPSTLADGTYSFSIKVANNTPTDETIKTISFTVDTTGPADFVIHGPKKTRKKQPTFTWTAVNPSDVDHFTCSLDGSTPLLCTSPFQPATKLKRGHHSLVVTAFDALDNPTAETKNFKIIR